MLSFWFLNLKEIKRCLCSKPIKLLFRSTLMRFLSLEGFHQDLRGLLAVSSLGLNNLMFRREGWRWVFSTLWIKVGWRRKDWSSSTNSQCDGRMKNLWSQVTISVGNVHLFGKENCIFFRILAAKICSTSRRDCSALICMSGVRSRMPYLNDLKQTIRI